MPLVVHDGYQATVNPAFHSSRDGKSKATKNNIPCDPLQLPLLLLPLIICIFPSKQEPEPGRGAITPQLELGLCLERHHFVLRKKHSWHDIIQSSCQEYAKYEDKHNWNGWISVLLREVYLVLIISLADGQVTFMWLGNSLKNSWLARREKMGLRTFYMHPTSLHFCRGTIDME